MRHHDGNDLLRRPRVLLGVAVITIGLLVGTGSPARADYISYEVVAQHSLKCLDVDNAYQFDDANVKQWSCADVLQQYWTLIPRYIYGQELFLLVARHSGKCLDVEGAFQNDDANVHQWTCMSAGADGIAGTADDGPDVPQQLWFKIKVGTVYDPDTYSYQPVFELRARHSNKCLDVSGASVFSGANVHQWTCVGAPQQHWLFRTLR